MVYNTNNERTTKARQGYINHVALALDESGSMVWHGPQLMKVVDGLIKDLAERSKEMDQETRVTIYTFGDRVQCLVYDKDVLRLPSIRQWYHPSGMTALIDAAIMGLEDLAQTPELYGDHAFLMYVLTDGLENNSRHSGGELRVKLQGLKDNWTVAALVPDARGKFEAQKLGFEKGNIAVWDATSERGVSEAGQTISQATSAYMTSRATGVRSTTSLFSMGEQVVNKDTIKKAGLQPVAGGYQLVVVPPQHDGSQIRDFVTECGHQYKTGMAYYQLSKSEKIQGQKKLAVVEKATGKVFVGDQVRAMVGLPEHEVRVKPDFNALYEIYVQSTSVNRKLVVGTKLLMFGV